MLLFYTDVKTLEQQFLVLIFLKVLIILEKKSFENSSLEKNVKNS